MLALTLTLTMILSLNPTITLILPKSSVLLTFVNMFTVRSVDEVYRATTILKLQCFCVMLKFNTLKSVTAQEIVHIRKSNKRSEDKTSSDVFNVC